MAEPVAGLLFVASLGLALVIIHRPLGDLLYWIATSPRDLAPERLAYRLIGADPKGEQTAVAQIPALHGRAAGSLLSATASGPPVGSRLIGQAFLDKDGEPLVQYFQSRPSAAGDGYDPTSTSASNLGPEDIVDALPDPKAAPGTDEAAGRLSLLSQVSARSKAVGSLEHVDGRRPFCTDDGVGSVLAVFRRDGLTGPVIRAVSVNQACPTSPLVSTWEGVAVECARFGQTSRVR
jgi:K+-transporting ATPase ATPase C chain